MRILDDNAGDSQVRIHGYLWSERNKTNLERIFLNSMLSFGCEGKLS